LRILLRLFHACAGFQQSIANLAFVPISQASKHRMNEENAMRIPGSNNDRQQSVAGHGPRQPERGVAKRNDHENAVKKTFISGALALLVLAYPAHASAQQPASADKAEQSHEQTAEASFMAENQAAMRKMMMDMAVKPSGNIDADFTAMMIPHHQGAVDMAEAELRYGHNKDLRRIARSIIAGQRQQIDAMKAALGRPLSEATSSATQSGHASRDGAPSAPNAAR
jgi:hypothetical protein